VSLYHWTFEAQCVLTLHLTLKKISHFSYNLCVSYDYECNHRLFSLNNINGPVFIRDVIFAVFSASLSFRSVNEVITLVFEQPSLPEQACIWAYRPKSHAFLFKAFRDVALVPYGVIYLYFVCFKSRKLSIQEVPDSNVSHIFFIVWTL
jgi:hypothetical protein